MTEYNWNSYLLKLNWIIDFNAPAEQKLDLLTDTMIIDTYDDNINLCAGHIEEIAAFLSSLTNGTALCMEFCNTLLFTHEDLEFQQTIYKICANLILKKEGFIYAVK